MRIVIIGAGSAGRHLAAKLCDEKHDIVVIDQQAEPLQEIDAHLDVLTVQGSGSSPRTLDEANIHHADLFVAVTDDDEVNILSCIYAHAAGVKNTVARVANMDYMKPSKDFELRKMGIDLVVSQVEACARELFNIISMPGTKDVVHMLDGRIVAAGFQAHMDGPIILNQLKDFPNQDLINTIRFVGVMRGDELLIPKGDTQFMIGDDVYVVGTPDNVTAFLSWASPEFHRFSKVIIAGGGPLGLSLAKQLETEPIQVILIEQNSERAHHCAEVLDKALVIKGDPLDPETIENAGITKDTAFVAVTDSDESNIISCLVAEKHNASFTLAQVDRPDYVPIIHNLSLLDRVVSSHISMIKSILHFVRGHHVMEATLLQNLPGELLDVVMPVDSAWSGKAIKDIRLPEGAIIATVVREDEILTATGELELAEGDRLIIFSLPSGVGKLESMFRK